MRPESDLAESTDGLSMYRSLCVGGLHNIASQAN